MAREYTVGASNITVAGATTLVYIRPSTTMALEVIRMWVSFSANATSAQQRVRVEIQSGTAPTLTGATPAKLKQADPVSAIVSGTTGAAGTCGINASAESGTKAAIWDDAFNHLNGWLWVATPRETIILPAGGSALGIFFPAAPATTSGWTAGLNFAELG
jgi:hypothetical protein